MKWFKWKKRAWKGVEEHRGPGWGLLRLMGRNCLVALIGLVLIMPLMQGCGMINPGRWKGIEKTGRDEKYYMVKDVFLTPGSSNIRKESFDHGMNETINLVFIPSNERNRYTAETIWYDPSDLEFRTIRTTYDKQVENKTGAERERSGTTRIHTISTKELYDHKPGLWKVALYLEGQLVRRISFSVM